LSLSQAQDLSLLKETGLFLFLLIEDLSSLSATIFEEDEDPLKQKWSVIK
jgi:hypothetical protein